MYYMYYMYVKKTTRKLVPCTMFWVTQHPVVGKSNVTISHRLPTGLFSLMHPQLATRKLRPYHKSIKNQCLYSTKHGIKKRFPLQIRLHTTLRLPLNTLKGKKREAKCMNILNIAEQPMFDDRFVKLVTDTYNPYANSTSIRITCESFLNVEGKVVIKHRNDESIIKLGNNCIAFMLDEIRYELNGVEIDYNRNVGITSTLKNYISFTCDEDKIMKNAGWNIRWNDEKNVKYHFNFCVLLKILFGFCEDYKHIVINARHEFILIRSRNDNNCLVGSLMLEPEIELFKVQWRLPHVILNDITKLSLLRVLKSGRNLSMCFRSWDLYEYPLLQTRLSILGLLKRLHNWKRRDM
ncbi:uncharacterized protein LOC143187606 [Calliopsis andreniformis]|uniref:uncharacterized protein LOC143187606 n=1 Tax=Calliopsis andreniformis TaxID=337506 RepID=UPI003FCE3917